MCPRGQKSPQEESNKRIKNLKETAQAKIPGAFHVLCAKALPLIQKSQSLSIFLSRIVHKNTKKYNLGFIC
jgi:hypothetical protein